MYSRNNRSQSARSEAASGPTVIIGGLLLARELGLQLAEHPVAAEHARDAGVRLAPLVDRRDELPVLQLDAVGGDVHVGDVDRLLAAGHQVVVPGDVGAVVADVAEEAAERTVVVEAERERADPAGGRPQL